MNHYQAEMNILARVEDYPLASQIQALEDVAASLLAKRAKILDDLGELDAEGFFPKYVIFNNITRNIDNDTFVLDPKYSSADMEAIEFYAQNVDSELLREDLNNWIYSHKNFTCKYPVRENCPIVGYNLCCGHCPNKDTCFVEGNTHLCNEVASEMFTSIEECEL